MGKKSIVDLIESQVIAAIKDPRHLDRAIESQANVAFLLTGDLFSTGEFVKRLKQNDMHVFLHLDFISGLDNSKNAIKFVATEWKPDGIITTKNHVAKFAKEEGLMVIQRVFLIDKGAVAKGKEAANHTPIDAIEVLPGLMPKVIDSLTTKVRLPIIAGGLIDHKEEVLEALEAGALATSVSNPALWSLDL
ncbi:glycerol-3-phosphate responsive antiterminator [Alteribacter aurantiacus]|uniref:glycerol-3-phosphate responsive antiterminator n=1 Tax=Alteribacter aurantiacus TaxID=254410 RepID=UPI00042892AB|nr:glycerol-3-phosphate responsive antiterminator [Alteribacter aurantiacus]